MGKKKFPSWEWKTWDLFNYGKNPGHYPIYETGKRGWTPSATLMRPAGDFRVPWPHLQWLKVFPKFWLNVPNSKNILNDWQTNKQINIFFKITNEEGTIWQENASDFMNVKWKISESLFLETLLLQRQRSSGLVIMETNDFLSFSLPFE